MILSIKFENSVRVVVTCSFNGNTDQEVRVHVMIRLNRITPLCQSTGIRVNIAKISTLYFESGHRVPLYSIHVYIQAIAKQNLEERRLYIRIIYKIRFIYILVHDVI